MEVLGLTLILFAPILLAGVVVWIGERILDLLKVRQQVEEWIKKKMEDLF